MNTSDGPSTSTLDDYLAEQESLIQEASLALPQSFSECTYSRGYIRQAIYLCKTCPEARGLCSACSIACHTDHEQLELFPKRNFRCDCPTSSIAHPCTLLAKTVEPENTKNTYNHNFSGTFCRCDREYDARTEFETMIQCLVCEDWFHESCLRLRDRPSSPISHPSLPERVKANVQDGFTSRKDLSSTDGDDDNDDDDASVASSTLGSPLIRASDYDTLVCRACVLSIPILRHWAGTEGTLMVVRDGDASTTGVKWKVLGQKKEKDEHSPTIITEVEPTNHVVQPSGDEKRIDISSEDVSAGSKRPRSASVSSSPVLKRRKSASPSLPLATCLAPPVNQLAQSILSDDDLNLGPGDVFFTEGWRTRWCHCEKCGSELMRHPYLLEEEETYEPPEDPDSGLSLEQLGMRALERLPRDRAIEGIHAFNNMKNDLVAFLKPFATQGKVVGDLDVKDFFEELQSKGKVNR